MISRDHRFHGNNSVLYVYRRGKIFRSKYFSAKFTINPRTETYRASVVVSKKVSKVAPQRNRIRRRMYELVRTIAAPKFKNIDIVFTIYDEEVANMPFNELRSVFERMVSEVTSRQ